MPLGTEWTDDELMQRVAQKDEEAFAELYARYQGKIYHFLRRYLGNSHEAEDLTVEVFHRVWRHARRYRAQGHFSAWIFRIARNLALQHLRRRRPRVSLDHAADAEKDAPVEWLEDPEARPDRRLRAERIREAVEQALAELPTEQREALLLVVQDGLSYQEVSTLLGISVSALKARIHRAREKLRRKLGSLLGEE